MSRQHEEAPAVTRGDIEQALSVAATLRNVYSIMEDGEGETPIIVELGKPWGPGEDGATVRYLLQDKSEWRFEVHVGCGEMCPVLAVVPYDFDSDAPHRETAISIAQAGEVIIGLVERVRQLEAAASAHATVVAHVGGLACWEPRQRLPTVVEVDAHAARHGEGAGWMVRLAPIGGMSRRPWHEVGEWAGGAVLDGYRRRKGETWECYPHVAGRPVAWPEVSR